eukprot:UN15145
MTKKERKEAEFKQAIGGVTFDKQHADETFINHLEELGLNTYSLLQEAETKQKQLNEQKIKPLDENLKPNNKQEAIALGLDKTPYDVLNANQQNLQAADARKKGFKPFNFLSTSKHNRRFKIII